MSATRGAWAWAPRRRRRRRRDERLRGAEGRKRSGAHLASSGGRPGRAGAALVIDADGRPGRGPRRRPACMHRCYAPGRRREARLRRGWATARVSAAGGVAARRPGPAGSPPAGRSVACPRVARVGDGREVRRGEPADHRVLRSEERVVDGTRRAVETAWDAAEDAGASPAVPLDGLHHVQERDPAAGRARRYPPARPGADVTSPARARSPITWGRKRTGMPISSAMRRTERSVPGGAEASATIARTA